MNESIKINSFIGHGGGLLWDLDQHRALFSREAHQLFIPASLIKLFTTIAALKILLPHFCFNTSVEGQKWIERLLIDWLEKVEK